MADVPHPIAEAQDAYLNIVSVLRDITRLQDKQLTKARQFNVENQLLLELKKEHLTDETRMASLQTSVVIKIKEIVDFEAIRRRHLVAAAAGSAAAATIAARHLGYIQEARKGLRASVKEYDRLLIKTSMLNSLLEIGNKTGFEKMLKFTQELRSNWDNHPILGLKTILLMAIKYFNMLDTAAATFRQEMGFTRTFTKGIDDSARQIAFNFAHIGVTAEIAYKSVSGITKQLFSSMSATTAMVRDVSILSAQLGISADASAEFMKNMGIVFRTTAGAQSNMTFFTAKLSEAAGVPLDAVMKDVSTSIQSSYQFVSRTGVGLIKAAIEAHRMGTSLKSATETSKSLLNFTQSVKNEMEASVLVGKSINLQKARELAYHRDIKGLNKEILSIMKETDFENLDPFQQDAVATALGKSAGELGNMAQAERERLGWERSTDPHVQAQLAAYKEMMAATESIANENGKNMRLQLQAKANQAAIASITQSWYAILNRIGEGILPLIEMTLRGIAFVLGGINRFFGWINDGASSIAGWLGTVTKLIIGAAVAAALLVGTRGLGRLISWATGGIGRSIGSMFGGIARGVGSFGKANVIKGAVGMLILGASIYVLAKAFQQFAGVKWGGVFIGLGALVLFGAVAAIIGVFSELIIPGAIAIGLLGLALMAFATAGKIGAAALKSIADVDILKIAKGLGSLGIAILPLAAITPLLPFMAVGLGGLSLALRLLAGPAERVGGAMTSVGMGLKMTADSLAQLQNLSLINTVMQVRSLASSIMDLSKAIKSMPDISIEKLKAIALGGGGGGGEGAKKDTASETLQAIKDAIDGLRSDFKSGAVTAAVYIDSQKLDAVMGRRLAYTGALV